MIGKFNFITIIIPSINKFIPENRIKLFKKNLIICTVTLYIKPQLFMLLAIPFSSCLYSTELKLAFRDITIFFTVKYYNNLRDNYAHEKISII